MQSRPAITLIILVCVILAGSFFLYQEKSVVYADLNSLKLIPQPETFTELYFENASYLPRATVAGQPISFSFGIHNVEYATMTYPYEVYFEYPDGSQIYFTSGTVTLASDASTSIPVTYTFQASGLVGKVVVDLPSLGDQQIDFLLPNNN
jgi:hypothetical protein